MRRFLPVVCVGGVQWRAFQAENTTLAESQEHESEWHVWGMARQLVCWDTGDLRELAVREEVTEGPRSQTGKAEVCEAKKSGFWHHWWFTRWGELLRHSTWVMLQRMNWKRRLELEAYCNIPGKGWWGPELRQWKVRGWDELKKRKK